MSNPGFYASIYEQIREYAELVDTVLISLKSGTSSPNDPKRQELGNLLITLSGETWDSLPTRMIALMLRDRHNTSQKKWAHLGKTLLTEQSDSSVIKDLEALAVALEQEQAGTINRMRGSLR